MRCSSFMLVLAGGLILSFAASTLAATPAQTCEARKLKAAGKDASCRASALAKMVLGGTSDPAACDMKLAAVYAKLDASGNCATTGDNSAATDFVDTAILCTNELVTGAFPSPCCTAQGGACLHDNDCCGPSPTGFKVGQPYFCNMTGGSPGFCDVLQ
jgi:hypothetical protein